MGRTLSTAEVARVLRVPESRIREIVRAGLLQPAGRGRRYAFAFDPDNADFIPPDRLPSGELAPLVGTDPTVTVQVTEFNGPAGVEPARASAPSKTSTTDRSR